jgi:hypothetical protein
MDFSKFSDDNFEAKQWVNAALKRKDENTELDVSVLMVSLLIFDLLIDEVVLFHMAYVDVVL